MSIDDGHKHLAEQLLEAQAQLAQARVALQLVNEACEREDSYAYIQTIVQEAIASGDAPPPASNNGPRGRRDAQEEARPYREQQDEKLAKAEAECERLREHARIVSDAAAAGVLTLGHILPLRACLPEFSAPPPAKEGEHGR